MSLEFNFAKRLNQSKPKEIKYVYDIPFEERTELCALLDQSKKYEELAEKYMGYDHLTVVRLRDTVYPGRSLTDQLLIKWGIGNHTILELFYILSQMKLYRAMATLKPFVDPKYHHYIQNGDFDFEKAMQNIDLDTERKILNVPSREDNESIGAVPVANAARQLRAHQRSDVCSIAESMVGVPQIPYEDLELGTNHWDKRAILGQGGFGAVFKGIWKSTQVAVKRIEPNAKNPQEEMKQLRTELAYLNTIRHDNVLSLYAYSIGGPHPCLVYQYMPGGSLEYRLYTKETEKILSWSKRRSIAIGAARGLQYMHNVRDKPVIHGDIKSANILLDQNDSPRIGDFGLAREGPQEHYSHIYVSRPQGTRPYLPYEFLRSNKFSTKVDTYSFGVVLFEIATGLRAYDRNRREKMLKDHVLNFDADAIFTLKDSRVEGGEECFMRIVNIGKQCVEEMPKKRPEMKDVLNSLEQNLNQV